MNYDEAKSLRDKNSYLEKRAYKGKEITHLAVVPVGRDALPSIRKSMIEHIDLDLICSSYEDFQVIGLLDFSPHSLNNQINYASLEEILHEQKDKI